MTDLETLQQRLDARPRGLDAARAFLQCYVHDADQEQRESGIRHMLTINPFEIESGIDALDELLAAPQPSGLLRDLVAVDANRNLPDPSDDGARTWLARLVADVRVWIAESDGQ